MGIRIRAEEFDQRAVGLKFAESLGELFVFAMAGEIDVENILPILLFRGARFDFRHVDLELIEGFEGFDQRTGLIADRKEDGGAVVAGRWTGFLGNNKDCLLYTSPSPRDQRGSRMPSSA